MAASNDNSSVPLIKIKQEPGIGLKSETGSSKTKTERLTSFKLPRDLTLGGSGGSRSTRGATTAAAAANKKVYVPNLNATRNKNTDVKTSRDTSQRGRGRNDKTRGGRGRGNSTVVQTTGIFSEGTAAKTLKRTSSSYSSARDADDAISQMRRPTIVKKECKVDPEADNQTIKELLGDDEEDEDDVEEKTKPAACDQKPISLHETMKIKTQLKHELVKIKTENNVISEIKTEPPFFNDEYDTNIIVKQEPLSNGFSHLDVDDQKYTEYHTYPDDLDEFFGRGKPQIFLLQLPDTLPGQGPDIEPADSAEDERPSTPDPTESFCTVNQLDEGLVGTIIRYKSGKTKLVLGDNRFDVCLGMDPGLLQEVVSITTNKEERSGNMINLGQIQAKLSVTPDWEHIFNTKKS